PEPARGYRESDRSRAPSLQRRGARVQHLHPNDPQQLNRRDRGLHCQAVLRVGAWSRESSEGAVLVRFRRPIVRSLAALLPALVAVLTLASPGRALEVPARPEGRVSDYAGLLSEGARQRIE